MLTIEDLVVSYGGIEALKGVSLEVEDGRIVTLVGANGAGKSTTLRAVVGLVKARKGKITYNGKDLRAMKTQEIVKEGIALVPEGRRVFANMTVLENLRIGAITRNDAEKVRDDLEWVFSLFPRLKERTWQQAGTLSGGEQQMLAIGRALMSRPRLMMMDEPSLGLAPLIVKDVFKIIREVNEAGVTILLIEQNAHAALQIADTGYVMETGRITMTGPGKDLCTNEDVKKAYLGEAH